MPKALTAACRPPRSGQGRREVGRVMAVPSRSISGLRVPKFTSGGTSRRRRHSTAFTRAITPAADSGWPRLALTEPTLSSAPPLRRPSAAAIASISMVSPSEVPVPCASTRPMSAAVSPASASAASVSATSDSTLGAVKPVERPVWLTAEPCTTACTRSPSRRASSRRLSTRTPQPSPRAKPFARASKGRHRPSGDRVPASWCSRVARGDSTRFTPPASATSHSRRASAWRARCTDTSEEEQAVSTVIAGPASPSAYATRPTVKQWPLPPAQWVSNAPLCQSQYSWPVIPTNSPVRAASSRSGGSAAFSSASQATSSSSRCCGSTPRASAGPMPKNSASKSITSSRNPPLCGSCSHSAANGPRRPAGSGPTSSRPSASAAQ